VIAGGTEMMSDGKAVVARGRHDGHGNLLLRPATRSRIRVSVPMRWRAEAFHGRMSMPWSESQKRAAAVSRASISTRPCAGFTERNGSPWLIRRISAAQTR